MDKQKYIEGMEATREMLTDTLTSIRAVKGDKYAEVVRGILSAMSYTKVIGAALSGTAPAEVGTIMLVMMAQEMVSRMLDAAGIKFDDELQNWIDTIDRNVGHSVRLAMEDKGDSPLQ